MKLTDNLKDVPESMRHLHPDATYLVCNKCGRLTFEGINKDCNFPQPNKKMCDGIIVGFSDEELHEKRRQIYNS